MKIISCGTTLKFDIQLDKPLAGYCVASAKPGESTWVIQKEFVSSEDGDLLVSRLEGLPSLLLSKIAQIHQTLFFHSYIDNMLALLRKNLSATIFINAPVNGLMQVKKSVDAGHVIHRDDIADVRKLVFRGIDIADDIGVIVLFSVGWRKGFFYDLVPLSPKGSKRDYDLSELLAGYYAYLSFQERFRISDSEWQSLFQNGWFPFIALKNQLVDNIINHIREGWNVDDLLPQIQRDLLERLPNGLKTWGSIKAFKSHIDFISKAAEHYRNKDHISSISVLFPRIEGILREFQSIRGQPEKAGQKDLAAAVLSTDVNPKNHHFSPLLPLRFDQYLTEVYFASFDPRRTDNPLSRNTVGHGVATKENFNLKGATLGFLILDQLSYYFCGVE